MIKYILLILSLTIFPHFLDAKSSCQKKIRRKKHRIKTELLSYRYIPAFCSEESEYFYRLGMWAAYEDAEKTVRKIHRRKKHRRKRW